MTFLKPNGVYGLIILSLLLGSCAGGGKSRKPRFSCSDRTAQAVKKYQKGSFASAKVILDDVKTQCSGAEMMDTVYYYLAASLMRQKLFAEAKLEFSRLVQEFPRSVFHEEARFRIACCVLRQSRSMDRDQTETVEAQRLFNDFLESYPSGAFADSAQKYLKLTVEKLAEKEFNTARFYQRIHEKEAAVIYYKSFVKEYPGSSLAPQARLNMGELLIELNRKAEAREVLSELIAQENKGETAAKARQMLGRCKE